MTPILADTFPTWGAVVSVLAFGSTLFGVWYMKRQADEMSAQTNLIRQQLANPPAIQPQPLAVKLIEELHQQFAGKKFVEDALKSNTERHGQLFSEIRRVEKEAREREDKRFEKLEADRRKTLDKLNEEFVFIRENMVEFRIELKNLNK